MPKIDWAHLTIDEVIYYYAFVFEIDMGIVLSMTLSELEEMAATKAAIEAWKHSD